MAQANVHERDYFTVAEAARELDVSPSTVWRWIEAKKLPAHRVGTRKIRIRKDDLRDVVTPARPEEPATDAPSDRYVFVPPTEEALARRQEAVARILESQRGRSIAPLTTTDLIHQVRQEREERYRSWMGLDHPEIDNLRVVEVAPDSELDRLLEETNGVPIVFVKNGVRYRVERESEADDIWANYDPERVLKVLAETAGAWKDIDTEALKADIQAQRGQDSHGRPA